MVRSYMHRTQRRSYTDEISCHAMIMVASGDLSKRQAMIKFGILRSTMAISLKNPCFMPISLGLFKLVLNEGLEKELGGLHK